MIGPQRIVCLTEEPTEVLYALGQQQRIVGISGFTVRPPQARKEKPKVSAFTSARIAAILRLKPDFVIGFSDIQADIAAALIRSGVEVWISNHRSVAGILDYIRRLGALVGESARAEAWAAELGAGLAAIAAQAASLPRRPRVYFEEWDTPRISGIRWVSELVVRVGCPSWLLRVGCSRRPLAESYKILYVSTMTEAKPVEFRGSSLDDLRAFPLAARREAGHQIDQLQNGQEADDWKPMRSVGQGVREIRIRDAAGAFRVIYVAKFADAVYVLHCFQKKSEKTGKTDLDLAAKRYRDLLKEVGQ